jgi:peptidylprolyl isomerase
MHLRSLGGSLLLTLAVACGGGDTKKAEPPLVPVALEQETFAPALAVDLKASTKLPSGLYIRDLVVGTGAEATAGADVSVRYAGTLVDGKQFDAVGPKDDPFLFVLGQANVIKGWDEGVVGMKVGGKRQLIIPSDLAYGRAGMGPIPSNANLVFTVELVGAK